MPGMRAPASRNPAHRFSIFAALCWCSAVAFGQSEFGAIAGSVSNESQAPATGITVEARRIEGGANYRAVSSAKGEYSLQLPAGKYEISIVNPNYRPYVSKDVVITAGRSQRLDIQLSQNIALLGTLGEIPALIEVLSKRPPPPQGPTPRMPDGKPDLSGVWQMSLASMAAIGQQPDLLPWAEALVRERVLNDWKDKPSARCLPELAGFAALWPLKIVQTPKLLVMLNSDVIAAHQVYLDGRGFPKDLEASWQGYSIGRWEGDTLVVETAGLNDKTWLGISPHTSKLHITNRVRRPDLGHLEVETAFDDPETFKTPFTGKIVNVLAPDEEIEEYVCAENNQYREHASEK
jgi:hypothetical protein